MSGLARRIDSIAWSPTEPGHFSVEFPVPTVPWLGTDGPHALEPGVYTIGVACLAPKEPGCGFVDPSSAVSFALTGPVPSLCAALPCAHVDVSPATSQPGTIVVVTGWAPLVGMYDWKVYELLMAPIDQPSRVVLLGGVAQAQNGDLRGSFVVPNDAPPFGVLQPGAYIMSLRAIRQGVTRPSGPPRVGAKISATTPRGGVSTIEVTQDAASFGLLALPSWSSVGIAHPIWIEETERLDQDRIIGDPAEPRRIVYCDWDGIRMTVDSGATWTTVPTDSVGQAAATSDFPVIWTAGTAPKCTAAWMDTANPNNLFAVFSSTVRTPEPYQQVVWTGYTTGDSGYTWRLVPVPSGHKMDDFGGFRFGPGETYALFRGRLSKLGIGPAMDVIRTRDGGLSWASGPMACPSAGPCSR